jgi:predicted ATPase/DNA-binding CsgD family transcriptional regulator
VSTKAADTAAVSEREAEVLEAVGRHLSNAQIANRLHISVRTVESHVSSLLRKFNVPDRRALADLAPAVTARPQVGNGTVVGLPATRTTFVGRSYEQAGVRAALKNNRLVTLLGPGGVGKTRLASEVAKAVAPEYPLVTVFVDLVSVLDGRVTGKVADLLGVTDGPGLSLDAALHEYLARGRSLLILDNCEHLLDVAAEFVEKLLADCAELTVLATSRERLVIPGERTMPIPPMSLISPDADDTARSEAEMLFLDRAEASDPEFTAPQEVLTELCARLDGMPLAIELAAARSASLGADSLLAELDYHLRLLAGSRSANERHSSLRAVIDWSHELLDDDERMMFRRAGVFAGAFDLAAAMEISSLGNRGMVADLIGRLTGKSLLSRRAEEGSRWQMLGTIRLYALDRLAGSGEETGVREAHLRWAANVANDLERRLEEGQPWRAAFDMVADDLRAALITATSPNGHEVSHRLARTLGHLTYACRFLQEARGHYEVAAAHASHPARAAEDLRTAADVAMAEGVGTKAFELLLASADQAAEAGDNAARAVALAHAATIADRFPGNFPEEMPHGQLCDLVREAGRVGPDGDPVTSAYLASAAAWTTQPEKSVPDPTLVGDALDAARRTGDPVLISCALDAVVNALDASGQAREAHEVNKERAVLLDRLARHDPRTGAEITDTFHMLTQIAVTAGDLPDALSTALDPKNNDIAGWQPHMAASEPILPLVLQGRFADALTRADNMWDAWQRLGRPTARWIGPAAYAAVLAHGLRGDYEGHDRWLSRLSELTGTDAHRAEGTYLASFAVFSDARIALHQGRINDALDAVADLPLGVEPWYGTPRWYAARPYAWAVAAEVAIVAGLPDAPDLLAAAAPAGEENYWAAACLARAAGRLHGDNDALKQSLDGWERIDAQFEWACTLLLLDGKADEARRKLAELGCEPPA